MRPLAYSDTIVALSYLFANTKTTVIQKQLKDVPERPRKQQGSRHL